jgi:hypothetical protein
LGRFDQFAATCIMTKYDRTLAKIGVNTATLSSEGGQA